MYSPRELMLIEALKTQEIVDAAKTLHVERATVDAMLTRIRDKIELARDSSNYAANWLDGGKYPRLAKLLRRSGD